MEYFELLEKYNLLLKENEKLIKENIDLKNQLNLPLNKVNCNYQIDLFNDKEIQLYEPKGIYNKSSNAEKINLFMSLFKGRTDVYAKRWQSKEGKSGYSPVCLNEWKKGICHKPTVKCFNCANKLYDTLTYNSIDNHLRGKEILGIYPLLLEDDCYFLAIDFDDEGWQKDITVLREVCSKKNIPFAVERSRSGNGAHVWFFFEDKISASIARKFGSALLTYAMSERHEIKFSSYDRLFPNQDSLPKGGFGNLIAFPLQYYSRKNKNSVFIDENFEPFKDQWQFLSNIKKLSEDNLEIYISELCSGNELGNLRTSNGDEIKPWDENKYKYDLNQNDFPNEVNIIRANMLYLNKEGFSNKALNIIKRMSSFKDPEFYKSQAMRLSTHDKPRIISLCEETTKYLCIPRGCETGLNELLLNYNIDNKYIDNTNYGKQIDVKFNGKLYYEQDEAFKALNKFDMGVLSATTAFGKTVIGAKLIAEKKVNTIVLVHTRQLLEQWYESLSKFLIIHEEVPQVYCKSNKKKDISLIGRIGGGYKNLNGIVDIAVMQSLVKGDDVKEFIKNYGMVIVDECHHISAFSFEQVLKNVTSKYIYGLTATPIRQDGHQPIIFMRCGPIRYKVNPKEQAEKRPFEHYLIPRFTSFRKTISQDEKEWAINDIYKNIMANQLRNELIINDIIKNEKQQRNSIVLTERTEHVKLLYDMLIDSVSNLIMLTGSMSSNQRKSEMEKLSKVSDDSNFVIIATGKFIGEGFDEPRLDTLFLAMPVAWKGTVQQYAGRLHRLYNSKKEVLIYDYIDVHVGVLERMYQKRLKGYASIGYSIKTNSKSLEPGNAIYDNSNFFKDFSVDVSSSIAEILIVSPNMSKKYLLGLMEVFNEGLNNGAKLTVVTKPISDYTNKNQRMFDEMIKILKNIGANIVLVPNIIQKFAVIDQRIVWYGGINLLNYGRSDENIIRLNNESVANELIGILDDLIKTS
ncbi:MAG: DEAD/DEAH box helicase family protein [Sedimentibacter sp.]